MIRRLLKAALFGTSILTIIWIYGLFVGFSEVFDPLFFLISFCWCATLIFAALLLQQ